MFATDAAFDPFVGHATFCRDRNALPRPCFALAAQRSRHANPDTLGTERAGAGAEIKLRIAFFDLDDFGWANHRAVAAARAPRQEVVFGQCPWWSHGRRPGTDAAAQEATAGMIDV
jgi:hypothetical protein